MINVAVVGFGWWGKHITARLKDSSRLNVMTVVEPLATRQEEARAHGVVVSNLLEEALNRADIDAVILTTPNPFHEEQVIASAKVGKHVFCEKPLGLTAASARRSLAACVEAGVQLGIGHERRFEPAMQELSRLISTGALGTIVHAESAFSHDKLKGVPKGDWRTSKAVSPAAGMTGMGIHLTDLYISMFGRIRTVQALTADRVLGWETGDVVSVQLRFEQGMTATLSAVLCTPHFIRMHVFGSQCWVEVRNDTHPDAPEGVAEMVIAAHEGHTRKSFDWTDTVRANLEAFADAVEGFASYPYTYEQMVHNIEVLEAISLSAESGETIGLCRTQPARA